MSRSYQDPTMLAMKKRILEDVKKMDEELLLRSSTLSLEKNEDLRSFLNKAREDALKLQDNQLEKQEKRKLRSNLKYQLRAIERYTN